MSRSNLSRRHMSLDAGKSRYLSERIQLSPLSPNLGSPRVLKRRNFNLIIIITLFALFLLNSHSQLLTILQQSGILPQAQLTCDNPYAEYGTLTLSPTTSTFVPYDATCQINSLLSPILAPPNNNPLKFPLPTVTTPIPSQNPWLHNKTVLLFGDSIELTHLEDFCFLTGGKLGIIDQSSPYSPIRFTNGIDERFGDGNNSEKGRPRICWLEEYDFMMIMVYHYGLLNRVEGEHSLLFQDEVFYPPVDVRDRLAHIVVPLLSLLARTPDLIEFSSGTYDLRHFTMMDNLTGASPHSELDRDRLEWYSDRLTKALASLRKAFPHTPILWRGLFRESDSVGLGRITNLERLARKVVKDINIGLKVKNLRFSFETQVKNNLPKRKPLRQPKEINHDIFLDRVNERIRGEKINHSEEDISRLVLAPIRVNEWGTLMLGSENGLGASSLWSEILLWELERITTKVPGFINRMGREQD